jgi:hypothetical protein
VRAAHEAEKRHGTRFTSSVERRRGASTPGGAGLEIEDHDAAVSGVVVSFIPRGTARGSVAIDREFEAGLLAIALALLLLFESSDLFDDEWR